MPSKGSTCHLKHSFSIIKLGSGSSGHSIAMEWNLLVAAKHESGVEFLLDAGQWTLKYNHSLNDTIRMS